MTHYITRRSRPATPKEDERDPVLVALSRDLDACIERLRLQARARWIEQHQGETE